MAALIPVFTTIPLCTNPLCPATHPHLVAEFGFEISPQSPALYASHLRLAGSHPYLKDVEALSIFTLCHGGAWSFRPDLEGPVEGMGLCQFQCHEELGKGDWDLQSKCVHGFRPADSVVRGRFVRLRSAFPLADVAVEQGVLEARDVFDDDV